MAVGFIITQDKVSDQGESQVGHVITRGLQPELHDRLGRGEGKRFRLLDDDGIVYFHGKCIATDEGSEEEFFPLEWASWYAGATEIQYKERYRWVTL